MKQLLWVTAAALLFTGCANTEKIEPESAKITFYFAPDSSMKTTFKTDPTPQDTTINDSLTWTIIQASMLPGEIGIHWDRLLNETRAESPAEFNPVGPRHDVSGKISPKIYGYYAVNLLDTVKIQQLEVGAKHYNHIHMVMLPESEVLSSKGVTWIEKHPELKTNSMAISGTVSNGTETKPFIFRNSKTYGENDLGDILIDLSIYDGDDYHIYIHPDFATWFSGVKWGHLTGADTIVISENSSTSAFFSIEGMFSADNAMKYSY